MARTVSEEVSPRHGQVEADEIREWFSASYEELCFLASRRLAHNDLGRRVDPHALVHEVFLRFVHKPGLRCGGRDHFLATASQTMRRIMVDLARRENSLRRGGDLQRIEGDEFQVAENSSEVDLRHRIHEALEKLAVVDALKAELVRLRFFEGLTALEVGKTLGLAERTVKWHWASAKTWLREEIARSY